MHKCITFCQIALVFLIYFLNIPANKIPFIYILVTFVIIQLSFFWQIGRKWLMPFSCSVMSCSLQTHGLQHARLPCPSLSSQSLYKFMSIESMIPSIHLILCGPLLLLPSIFPSLRVFSNESVFRIRRPSIGVSASASVLPMNTQGWFPLGLTSLISLQSKGLSRLFSSTTVWKHQFFSIQPSL